MKTLRITCALALLALAPVAMAQDVGERKGDVRTVHLMISGPEQLAAEGWQKVGEGEWRHRIEGREVRVAFGLTALEHSLAWLDRELAQLAKVESPRAVDKARQLYLEEQRDQLIQVGPILATKASGAICNGNYEFVQSSGQIGFATFGAESYSRYWEFGPLSPGDKTIFADADVYNGSASDYDSATNYIYGPSNWSASAQANAQIYPYFGGTAENFGYVLVTDSLGCTDIVSLTS